MNTEEKTPPLNEAELEALDKMVEEGEYPVPDDNARLDLSDVDRDAMGGLIGVLPTSKPITSDQVAVVIRQNRDCYSSDAGQMVLEGHPVVRQLADLYAAADPSFNREEFLRRCGV